MKIPKRFKLLGSTITVEVSDDNFKFEDSHNDCIGGWSIYRKNRIEIRPSSNKEMEEHAFWHELTHFVMYHAGGSLSKTCDFVHKEENFVDLVAGLYMQAINSFEYDEDGNDQN